LPRRAWRSGQYEDTTCRHRQQRRTRSCAAQTARSTSRALLRDPCRRPAAVPNQERSHAAGEVKAATANMNRAARPQLQRLREVARKTQRRRRDRPPLDTFCHLATIALATSRPEWDAEKELVTNNPGETSCCIKSIASSGSWGERLRFAMTADTSKISLPSSAGNAAIAKLCFAAECRSIRMRRCEAELRGMGVTSGAW